MDPAFMVALLLLRRDLGFPFAINSGYRCALHPVEAAKRDGPGTHTDGVAADVLVWGPRAARLYVEAWGAGFTGLGLHQDLLQALSSRYLHLDRAPAGPRRPEVPWTWTYPR